VCIFHDDTDYTRLSQETVLVHLSRRFAREQPARHVRELPTVLSHRPVAARRRRLPRQVYVDDVLVAA
jgi:hypothetical protein